MSGTGPDAPARAAGPVRIALVTHYFDSHRGGVESVAGQLARRLAASGRWSIEWVSSDASHPPPASPGIEGIAVRAFNGLERRGFPWPVWGFAGIRALARAIARADIVHIHDFIYFPNIVAFVLACRASKPLVVTQHIGDVPFDNPILSTAVRLINRTLGRWMLSRADRVVFISDAVRRTFEGFVHFRRAPLHVPNGVDTDVFHPVPAGDRARLRASLGVGADERVILYVGRFVDKKGLPLLGRLARTLPGYRWWFAGWGEPSSASHPSTWNLPHATVFGDRSGATLAELYVAADLLVLASLSEGFPLVVQESMACGTPVLIAEAIAEGAPESRPLLRLASIHGADPVAQWTRAIASALDENEGRIRTEALAAFALSHWSWPATMSRYETLFDDALARASGLTPGRAPTPPGAG